MPYSIEDVDGRFRSYLAGREDLSREDRVKLYGLLDLLRTHGDDYRMNAALRCAPDSTLFVVHFVFRGAAGKLHQFRFVVDDASAVYGVLRILYVDEV